MTGLRNIRAISRLGVLASLTATTLFLLPLSVPPLAQPNRPRTSVASPSTDVFLVPLSKIAGELRVGVPQNVTHRDGYDNQPSFSARSDALYFTSNRGDGQTDIYRNNFSNGLTTVVRKTSPESEYSAMTTRDGRALTVIRVEADSTQRVWRMPLDGSAPEVMFPSIKPVGYFAQSDDSTWALFVLADPATNTPITLQIAVSGHDGGRVVARNIGRSLHRIPGTKRVSYVQKSTTGWWVMSLDPSSGRADTLVRTMEGSEDVAWVDSTTLLAGKGSQLFAWQRGSTDWKKVGDFDFARISAITRLAVSPNSAWLAIVAEQKQRVSTSTKPLASVKVSAADVQRGVDILAADSMEGRMTGSVGQERAASWLESRYRAISVLPAGDSGTYRQRIPLAAPVAAADAPPGRRPPSVRAVESWAAWGMMPETQRRQTSNVAAMIRGSDPTLRDEVVLVTAHYDHIGIGNPVDGDSINNGADDDASGNIALLEIAKALKAGPAPRRTILFVSITGEEVGGFGTSWYLRHPLLPLEKTVVDLNIEMIAHPDSLAGGFGKAWVTGYERSTLGDLLADNGIPVVPDPRPGQNFFSRSDNVAFARAGIPAHSISTFNLETPYHNPKDEASTINAEHMAWVIEAITQAVRLLGDGLKPEWHPGGKPEPRTAR